MRQMIYAVGLLAATALPAQAQDVCSQYRPTPTVGSWAEYKTSRGGQEGSMRMAIVGREKRDGKDAVWFEMSNDTPRGKMVMEALVPGFPYESESVLEMVVKRGDQPAMKVPAAMMAMGRSGQGAAGGRGGRGGRMNSNWAEQCKTMTVVGQESVTVPGGTFKATHLRSTSDSSDIWVSPDAPFGVVKSATAGGSSMELTGKGTGAKKSITETPQEMQGMPGQ